MEGLIITQENIKINNEIKSPEVRLINSQGEQVGIVPIDEALKQADEAELDLVEIASKTKPPVCKVMDFGKYKYEMSKKRDEARKKQKQIQIKEIKFRPSTDEGDYNIKLRNIKKFIFDDGNKVKVTLRFRGREMSHQEIGLNLLKRIEEELIDNVTIEQRPKLEGRQLVMLLAPKKK